MALFAALVSRAAIVPVITAGGTFQFGALESDGHILSVNAQVLANPDGTYDTAFKPFPSAVGSLSQVAATTDGVVFGIGRSSDPFVYNVYRMNADGTGAAALPITINTPSGLNVHFLPLAGGKMLLWGGPFSIGAGTKGLVRVNADGSVDSTFDVGAGPDVAPSTVSSLPNGQLLIGGEFATYDLARVSHVVRLNADGTLDSTFNAQVRPPDALQALPDGGAIASLAGTLTFIHADGSTGPVLGSVGGTGLGVSILALQPDGQILAGGDFDSYNGVPVGGLFRLNSDGTLDNTFSGGVALANLGGNLAALAVQGDGRILVSANGRFARLDANGTPDSTIFGAASTLTSVLATAKAPDGRTFVAGLFTSASGSPRMSVAAFLPTGALDDSFVPSAGLLWGNPANNPVTARIAVGVDGSVYVTGSFTGVGTQIAAGIARYLPNGTVDPNFAPALNSGDQCVAVATLADGRIAVGGFFSQINGLPRGNFAAFGTDGALDPAFGVGSPANAGVTRIVPLSNGGCLLGGSFTMIGAQRCDFIGEVGSDGSVNPNFSSTALSNAPVGLAPLSNGGAIVATRGSLVRLGPDGSLTFTYNLPALLQNLGASAIEIEPTAVAVDPDLNVFVALKETGTFLGGINGSGLFVVKLDASGGVMSSFPTESLGSILTGSLVNDASVVSLATGTDGSLAVAGTIPQIDTITAYGLELVSASDANAGVAPVLFAASPVADNSNVAAGSSLVLSVFAAGANLTYQWSLNGAPIPGATFANYAIPITQSADTGAYTVGVSGPGGSTSFAAGTVTVTSNAWLTNLSCLANVPSAEDPLIVGFTVAGNSPEAMLIRGVGPELAKSFGVANALSAPLLTLHEASGTVVAQNQGWDASLALEMSAVGAFQLTPGSNDTALSESLSGRYTAMLTTANGQSGTGLLELYDESRGNTPNRLVNLSARALVPAAHSVTAGFVIGGTSDETVLIRGVGPELAKSYGVTNALTTTSLTLFDGNGQTIAQETGWNSAPVAGPSAIPARLSPATAAVFSQVEAFSLTADSADSALVATLPPGTYTVQLSAPGGGEGTGLIEVYEVGG